MRRSKLLVPVVALILTLTAITAVWLLVARASASRAAQLQTASLRLSLADLQTAPFNADPAAGGSPTAALVRIHADERSISLGLTVSAQPGVSVGMLTGGRSELAALEPVVTTIYRIAVGKGGLVGGGSRVTALQGLMVVHATALSGVLDRIGLADASRATRARTQMKLGATVAMLLLLIAFAYYYLRSVAATEAVERLAHEKEALLRVSRIEASTDALTQLGNRRALARRLAAAIAAPPEAHELLLVMFDLDGFKQYNDTFGHLAGDALLQRLGVRLAAATGGTGAAYRMGGDEFCVLARVGADSAEQLLNDTVSALQDDGDGWHVGCSHGAVWIPSESATGTDALNLADARMYANKATRSPASQQVTDALLQVITEQNVLLDDHVERVSELAGAVAETLGEPEHEVARIRLAARLHDVGKTAIPAAILDKPGPLDEREWEFVHRHSQIGERIVLAAPALAATAPLIRSSHERVDGNGYPDGLAGQDIPLGSRVIAVCDAFDAMTSERPYRQSIAVDAALAELARNAGSQFDARVVEAFCRSRASRKRKPTRAAFDARDAVDRALDADDLASEGKTSPMLSARVET
jgi:diguanylate cyclase (GGDEF)-like protein